MRLNVEAEVHNVAILHDVFFALDVEQAGFFHGGFTAVFQIVVILDNLCTNKAAFKVGVDHARTLRRFPAFAVRPGLHFHFAGRDKRFELQHLVSRLYKPIDAALIQSHVVQKFAALLVGFQFGDVGFRLRSYD